MSQELIYTSAPQGLKPGSRGFCTVASTAGMPKNLAERLESFSGYRHVFPPNDANAIHNPVVYSHLRIVVGGRPYHVLSRISAAGIDYTQRSNKLAHHIALDVQELVPAGPAALLACRDFMDTTWVGEPRVIAAGRRPPQVNSVQGVCRHWERLTGDAGWGGRLADAASSKPLRTVAVIFKPGMDVLPLVSESLSLLPPAIRWQVTFSTYFTKLPPGIDCHWRFLLEGSPEAKAAERSSQVETIVLGKKLGPAPDSPLVVAARTGKPPTWPQTETSTERAASELTSTVEQYEDRADSSFDVSELNPIALYTDEFLEPPLLPANARRFQRLGPQRRSRWPLVLCTGGIATLIVIAALSVTASFRQGKVALIADQNPPQIPDVPLPSEASQGDKGSMSTAETTQVDSSDDTSEKTQVTSTPAVEAPSLSPIETPQPQAPPQPQPQPNAENTSSNQNGSDSEVVQPDTKQSDLLLYADLGERPGGSAISDQAHAVPRMIATVGSDVVAIELVGGETVLGDDIFLISPKDDDSYDIQITQRGRTALTRPTTIANVTLARDSVMFNWMQTLGSNRAIATKADQLRNCLIQIASRQSPTTSIALRTPIVLKGIRIKWGVPPSTVSLPIRPWPTWPISLQVNDPPAGSGYYATPVKNGGVEFRHSDTRMPVISMSVSKVNATVTFGYDSQYAELRNKDATGLKTLINETYPSRLTNLSKEHTDALKRLNETRDDQIRSSINARIADIDAEIGVINEKTLLFRQCLLLDNLPVPFAVAANIEGSKVIIAVSGAELNSWQ